MARAPYPGLRPFERDEADIFFGRETHVDAMVDRLGRHRALAVTGSSGSGKSSLVRAGLLEALETGLLATAGPEWRFAIMRPREHPMSELAVALFATESAPHAPDDVALRLAALERGPLSVGEELREHPLPEGANLLILVDQFEELFRYRGLSGREEAEAFVALLLASAAQRDAPIYVVLTMRSDFFGECAQFEGLAEVICDSLYLCPRLNREQIITAIEGPAAVFGGRVEPLLVSRIVNDMGLDPDQLPLMQHALMRLWDRAQASDPKAPLLRLDDYLAFDGIKGCLSRHADEILAGVVRDRPGRLKTAQRLFCLLTEGEGDRAVRRLAPVSEIMAVTDQPLDEIRQIIDSFRGQSASLLLPTADEPLRHETVLDISHEALIRQWQRLTAWVRQEAEAAEYVRDIERRVRRWETRREVLRHPRELRAARSWSEYGNLAWAKRYCRNFDLIEKSLEKLGTHRIKSLWGIVLSLPLSLTTLFLLIISAYNKVSDKDVVSDKNVILYMTSVYSIIFVFFLLILPFIGFRAARNIGIVYLMPFVIVVLLLIDFSKWAGNFTKISVSATATMLIICLLYVIFQLHRLARGQRVST